MTNYQLLEKEFANYIGTDYAVAVNSGTSALTLSIAALGIGPGDEVIVPEFTMIASAWAVTYNGATPVFVDCGEDLNINPWEIEKKISSRTKAIMVTHVYGRMVNIDHIKAIANEHNLLIIEDACEAQGAHIRGKKAGSFGIVGCFSFFKNKIVSAEEGGIITTDDKFLYDKMQDMKNMSFGDGHNYYHQRLGFNFRMPESQAKLALESLSHVDENLVKRWAWAEEMDKIPGITKIPRPNGSVIWVYDFLMDSEEERNEAILKTAIPSRVFFKPMSMQPMYYNENHKFLRSYDYSKRGMYLIYGV